MSFLKSVIDNSNSFIENSEIGELISARNIPLSINMTKYGPFFMILSQYMNIHVVDCAEKFIRQNFESIFSIFIYQYIYWSLNLYTIYSSNTMGNTYKTYINIQWHKHKHKHTKITCIHIHANINCIESSAFHVTPIHYQLFLFLFSIFFSIEVDFRYEKKNTHTHNNNFITKYQNQPETKPNPTKPGSQ